MAHATSTTLEQACGRRFPAWTLYARAFSGSRSHADYLVQKAVSGVSKEPAAPATEAEFHAHVLEFIRESALRSMPAPSRSILGLIHAPCPGELEAAQKQAATRLSQLPRDHRRSIERVLLRRPAWSLEKVAARDGVSSSFAAATIESGLRTVAARVRGNRRPGLTESAGTHPPLDVLLAYVQGVLTADEARSVVSHGGACVACGDRLGTMMLLKAASIETLRLPRLPRGTRRTAAVLLVAGLLAVGFLLVRELMPNPWQEHATRENVPGWFYSFLYRGEDPRSASEIARGLSLLVEGKHEEAIEALEPWARRGRATDPEASTYLGIARYLNGDSSRGTIRLLETGTSSLRSGRLARWYLASALLSCGDVDGATLHLKELATVHDWFGRAAEALLERLEQAKDPRSTLAAG